MNKKHLIFLHGALGCNTDWLNYISTFEEIYEVHNLNFPQHGNSTEILDTYSYQKLALWLASYVHSKEIRDYFIIGYSMGGYIALKHTLEEPKGCLGIITIATKVNWNIAIATYENTKLSEENLTPIIPKLKIEHGNKWHHLIDKTKDILNSIGLNPLQKEEFTHNRIPVFMLLGSKDKMVTTDETINFISENHHMTYKVLEDQEHLLERMDMIYLTEILKQNITSIADLTF